ncbi:unnamed protein product, partial [Ectocarpus sp. 12 AP-2014]
MSVNVAVIGLGSMGYGMARSCVQAGLNVYGFDVVAEPVARLVAEGGNQGQMAELAPSFDAVVVVVLNAAQVETVLFGKDGIVPRLRSGAVVMACATVPPAFAKDMENRCKGHGVHYLDAPISGGSVKASQGNLSVMASGSAEAFTALAPVLEATAEKVFHLGGKAGAGSAMKAVN